jgi:hypothetical protein
MKELTPSTMPKLAECSLFEGGGVAGPAALRGTNIDKAIRHIVEIVQVGSFSFNAAVEYVSDVAEKILKGYMEEVTEEDVESVRWGVVETLRLAHGNFVETRETHLAMGIPALSKIGTADGSCVSLRWVLDYKTGANRNYREQLAAYSLACMIDNFEDEWTAHVLYVDQRMTRTYSFTKSDAERIVSRVIDNARSPEARPTPCEYCSWCKHYSTCDGIVRQAKGAIDLLPSKETSLDQILQNIVATDETLSAFAQNWKLAEKAIAEPAFLELRTRIEGGNVVDGWQIVEVNGREFADKRTILTFIKDNQVSVEDVVAVFGGKMSGDKFRELAAKAGTQAPELPRGASTKQLRQTKTKNK